VADNKDEEDEEDDGFFVPHGYLSNDEGDLSDGEIEMGFPEDVSLLNYVSV